MPTYDYLCSACGHHFEEFQSMTAKELRKCPECKKNKLDRLIGAGAGVIFKGSGFYTTDYRGSGYSSDKKKDSDAPAEGAGKSGGADNAKSGDATPKKVEPSKADSSTSSSNQSSSNQSSSKNGSGSAKSSSRKDN